MKTSRIATILILVLILLGIVYLVPDTKKTANEASVSESLFIESGIKFIEVEQAKLSDPKKERVVVETTKEDSFYYLSGMILRNSEGQTISLGKAVNIFRQGVVNKESRVVIPPGTKLIISSGESPLGYSFRENSCTGFLDQYQDFYPSLGDSCPSAEKIVTGQNFNLMTDCQIFVSNIPSCKNVLSDFPENISPVCQETLRSSLNYNSCVDVSRRNSDFLKDTWRIYLGRDEEFWKNDTELIEILDESGKLLGSFAY